jgi:hypothetical protein
VRHSQVSGRLHNPWCIASHRTRFSRWPCLSLSSHKNWSHYNLLRKAGHDSCEMLKMYPYYLLLCWHYRSGHHLGPLPRFLCLTLLMLSGHSSWSRRDDIRKICWGTFPLPPRSRAPLSYSFRNPFRPCLPSTLRASLSENLMGWHSQSIVNFRVINSHILDYELLG